MAGPSWAALSAVDWVGLIVVLAFWVLVPIVIYLVVSRTPSPRGADDQETWDWLSHAKLFTGDDGEPAGETAGRAEAAPAQAANPA